MTQWYFELNFNGIKVDLYTLKNASCDNNIESFVLKSKIITESGPMINWEGVNHTYVDKS